MDLDCSFCLYDENRPVEGDEDYQDTQIGTVMNGHLTCLYHAGYCQGGEWTLVLAAIKRQQSLRLPEGHPRAGQYGNMIKRDTPHDALVQEPNKGGRG